MGVSLHEDGRDLPTHRLPSTIEQPRVRPVQNRTDASNNFAADFSRGRFVLRAAPTRPPEPSPTQTVPAAAAEAGKDVVHQLNNAFAKVFEIVAPSVVIIEVTKKADGNDTSSLDDLLFQNQPDENSPRGASARFRSAAKRRLRIHR